MKNMYIILAISVILEVIGTTNMKLTEGFTNLVPSIIAVVSYGSSLVLYVYLSKLTELGIINALWSAFGTALVVVAGMMMYNEALSMVKILGILLILAGVVGLNVDFGFKQRRAATWDSFSSA
ncbi:multidrug efflux SMR transporter [Thalassobacillus sp. CUG 92003]|uniref:DMT family transporter n=1 Tax=Thalassobacillus sp. CUG 92003 TaxID=2736641 RepID=UPI0015E7BE78|nr:multidrug efflux SMR transporter [Thalassobacillus sp. CUG 92003]